MTDYDEIAQYYATAEREASEYAEQLRHARRSAALAAEEVRRLERLLEQARYVGD